MPLIPIFIFDDVGNDNLSLMEWCQPWEPGMPVNPASIGQGEKQIFIWGTSTVLWVDPAAVDNSKLAFMEWCCVYEPGLPVSPGAIGQDDQQQFLWGHPEVLWGSGSRNNEWWFTHFILGH